MNQEAIDFARDELGSHTGSNLDGDYPISDDCINSMLEAAAPYMDAVGEFKAEAWERAQVKWGRYTKDHPVIHRYDKRFPDSCLTCRLNDVAEVLGIEVTG